MQVTNGFRDTEVGPLPNDWRCGPLTNKIEITHGYGFKSQYFTAVGPYKLTTPGHFFENGGFRDIGDKQKYYDGPVPNGYVLEQGDIIVAMTEQADGLLGSAAMVPESGLFLHNQRLGKLVAKTSEFDFRFLFRVFNSPKYRAKVRETAAGTKVKHTSPQKLLEIAVLIPPLAEQRAIAEALSDVDALINALDALITKKRHIKQGTMQQLLTGKTRLPGFRGEWEETMLGELAAFLSGGTPSRSNEDYWTGDIPWISASSLRCFEIWRSDSNVTEAAVAAGSKMAPVGSTLLLVRGSALHKEILCGLVTKPVCFNQDVKALVPHPRVVPRFLTTVMTGRAEDLLKLVSSAGNTAGVLDTKLLKAFPLNLPNPEEQTAIAEVISDMDAEINALEQKRKKTKLIKQGMMQELLTGKTRLV